MSTASVIADYVRHSRSLGKRFIKEEAVLSAFSRSVGKIPLRDISPATIRQFVNRDGTSDGTMANKHSALKGFFRYALTRGQLKSSPMPSLERRRGAPSFTPYIYSEAELKRILAAVPAAIRSSGDCYDRDIEIGRVRRARQRRLSRLTIDETSGSLHRPHSNSVRSSSIRRPIDRLNQCVP